MLEIDISRDSPQEMLSIPGSRVAIRHAVGIMPRLPTYLVQELNVGTVEEREPKGLFLSVRMSMPRCPAG